MTEKEMEAFIESVTMKGMVLGLESISRLLDKMGHPEQKLAFVHIAGTNGKGSVLAYTSTILKEAGYRVGRYLSPVINEYREKIQVNGRMISKKDLMLGMEFAKKCVDELVEEGFPSPTIFEIETAIAFWYYDMKKCDIVVLETGMGGRDDATNIIPAPLVCAFASISMDHIGILGRNISEIAQVKAGIIKKGAIVVSAEQRPEAAEVLLSVAKANNCAIHYATEPVVTRENLKGITFNYGSYKALKSTMIGSYQPGNAAVAIEIIEALRSRGMSISDENIYAGIEHAEWTGRFEVVKKKPLIIMDGAHNEDASIRLRQSITGYIGDKPMIFIVGVLADKEYEKVLANTLDLCRYCITVTPPSPRALSGNELAIAAGNYNSNVTCAGSVEEALEMAALIGNDEYVIIAFGSLSFLGKFKRAALDMNGRKEIKL